MDHGMPVELPSVYASVATRRNSRFENPSRTHTVFAFVPDHSRDMDAYGRGKLRNILKEEFE